LSAGGAVGILTGDEAHLEKTVDATAGRGKAGIKRDGDVRRGSPAEDGKAQGMTTGPAPGEVYSFGYTDTLRSGKVLMDEGYEPLDGDWAKVQIADLTDDGGARPLGAEIKTGRPVDPTPMPTTFRYTAPRHQGLRDVMPFLRGTTLVSPGFRDLVERFEPGVHQFLPVRMLRKDTHLGGMFLMVIAARIDGLNHALCEPPLGDRRVYVRQIGSTWRIVFDPERIAGHHLWFEKHLGYFFISGSLLAACEQAEIEGLRFGKPQEVVPRG
jgi:hypothetical protein